MQSPHFYEFKAITDYINDAIEGAQLQEIISFDWGLGLGLYRFHQKPQVQWLFFDLAPQSPFICLCDENPWYKLKKVKPLGLFLSANFKNSKVENVLLKSDYGRVLEIFFNTGFILQFRCIPRQPNLMAVADKKNMFWNKPKDLLKANLSDIDFSGLETRSVPYMFKQWIEYKTSINQSQKTEKSQVPVTSYQAWINQRQKDIDKKSKAKLSLFKQIDNPQIAQLQEVGEHLKIYGFKKILPEHLQLVNQNETVNWNIQKCFEKAKLAKNKIQGAANRLHIIEKEIEKLTEILANSSEQKFQQYVQHQSEAKLFQVQKRKSSATFRQFLLSPELGIYCYIGKSAAENLKLLRQAKAWDLWLHLKDYPSAYAIIQKNKDQSISDEILRQAAQWLVKESVKAKDSMIGSKLSVVIVDCRHVRPIKGDKIGRVTYNHAREMLITV